MSGSPVVFGVDFSPIIGRAIPWVREFVAPGRPIILAHAIDRPPLPGFLHQLVPATLAAEHVCPQMLARLQVLADVAGVSSAERVVRCGRADRVLRDMVAERSASLLVIGAHGIPTRPWKRVGTTAERLLRSVRQSVLVANGPMVGPPTRIVVAVDDVEITPRLLALAGGLADTHRAELTAVHVLSTAAYSHVLSAEAAAGGDDPAVRQRVETDLAEETLRWLRELWANTRRHSALHAEVPHGDPADEILRIARDRSANLIVMGRYGIGRVVPAVLGSVLGTVIAGAECPVLVAAD